RIVVLVAVPALRVVRAASLALTRRLLRVDEQRRPACRSVLTGVVGQTEDAAEDLTAVVGVPHAPHVVPAAGQPAVAEPAFVGARPGATAVVDPVQLVIAVTPHPEQVRVVVRFPVE